MKKTKNNFSLINEFYDKKTFKKYIKETSFPEIRTNKKVIYYNIPAVIDIETSSFIDIEGEKTGIMYCFTLGINGRSFLGRTYKELFEILSFIENQLQLSLQHRLIIYVHNLAYEFQFFYKRFTWEKIFATAPRTPLTALTTGGIEFRCSFLLSGYSLAKIGEHLQKYKVEKKVGDLDYSKIRHSKTKLDPKEKGYVLNDGLVVMAYIQEQIESHKGYITRIPLTKTGEVRKYCRNQCLYGGVSSHKNSIYNYKHYSSLMKQLRIVSVNEYKQLKRAFMGGFTHANGIITGNTQYNVDSFDFTSSYPYVMVSEKFPMSKGELVVIKSKEDLRKNLEKYCCLMDITFENLTSKIHYEHYISLSHCVEIEDYQLDNGRIVTAKKLSMTITERDFFIIEKVYSWSKMKIRNFRRYRKDYLPVQFVKAILKLYEDKTKLKDIEGKEIEYLYSKELLNSCYGMSVTDICRAETKFDYQNNVWIDEKPVIDYEKDLEKYNNSKQRFLSYAWGVWVTAYARYNLWQGIFEFGNDYCYSDTDSVKGINSQDHLEYIKKYNDNCLKKLQRAMNHHHLNEEMIRPKTITGEEKILGVYECDGHYKRFKTLGAKRYMVDDSKKGLSLTVSGLNKKIAIPYLKSISDDIFEEFKEGMYIPKGHTGKNIHTYIDEERNGLVTDYFGQTITYHELSCIHLSESDYSLSISRDYVDYLLSIRLLEYN